MAKFIEVHWAGDAYLINTEFIEEIRPRGEDSSAIYFAFQANQSMDPDYIYTDESYDEVKRMIMEE